MPVVLSQKAPGRGAPRPRLPRSTGRCSRHGATPLVIDRINAAHRQPILNTTTGIAICQKGGLGRSQQPLWESQLDGDGRQRGERVVTPSARAADARRSSYVTRAPRLSPSRTAEARWMASRVLRAAGDRVAAASSTSLSSSSSSNRASSSCAAGGAGGGG